MSASPRAWCLLGLSLLACASPEASSQKLVAEKAQAAAPPESAPSPAALERQRRREERARRAEQRRREAEAERARREAERLAFERRYPLHGVVFHYVAQVFSEPSDRGRAIGYMRRGSMFRAKRAVSGPGCGQWHEVAGGGFVCAGKGYIVGEGPQHFEPSPAPPALDDALPYAYGYTVRDDVPQHWVLPTLEQEEEAAAVIRTLAAAERRRAQQSAAAGTADAGVAAPEASADAAAESEEAPADAVEAPPPPGQHAEAGTAAAEGGTGEGDLSLPGHLRLRMLRGFYASIDRSETTEAGRRFFRTVRGAYVRETDLVANEPPASRGVALGGDWSLPLAIVYRRGAQRYAREPATGRLADRGTVDRHTAFVVADETLVRDDRRFVVGRNGTIVRDSAARIARPSPRPPGVPPGAKWIHVDLSEQTLVAYEGDTPVFATLVSTGKEGHETPAGLYRIQSKHVSTTMDDDSTADGAYSIEDVPWTMYFHGNFALHGAFWHYTFGRTRSHGCVNLSPADARWLFFWSTPSLPTSWHGVFADPRRDPGTYVFID